MMYIIDKIYFNR